MNRRTWLATIIGGLFGTLCLFSGTVEGLETPALRWLSTAFANVHGPMAPHAAFLNCDDTRELLSPDLVDLLRKAHASVLAIDPACLGGSKTIEWDSSAVVIGLVTAEETDLRKNDGERRLRAAALTGVTPPGIPEIPVTIPEDVHFNAGYEFGVLLAAQDSSNHTQHHHELVVRYGDVVLPSMAARAVSASLRLAGGLSEIRLVTDSTLRRVRIGQLQVPVSETGDLLVMFPEPGSSPSWPRPISVTELKNSVVDLSGTIVFIGRGADAIHLDAQSRYWAPHGINAVVTENILARPIPIDSADQLATSMLAAFVLSWIAARLARGRQPMVAVLAGVTLGPLYILLCTAIFVGLVHWRLHVVAPLLGAAASGVVSFGLQSEVLMRLLKRFIKDPRDLPKELASPDSAGSPATVQELTVLVADVVNFTQLTEGLTLSEFEKLRRAVTDAMIRAVQRYGGKIDRTEGDGIVAFFVESDGNSAVRACGAAVDLQFEVEALNRTATTSIVRCGVGLHSGRGSVGHRGSQHINEWGVSGEVVTVAKRVEESTRTFNVGVVVSDDTRMLVKQGFVYKDLGQTRIQGREKPIRVWQVVGRDAGGLQGDAESSGVRRMRGVARNG